MNGDTPATISVGDTYADLGAQITGPQEDLNLGIHLYIDGAAVDAVQLDTSVAGKHTIDYVATDAGGSTATSTRTVIIAAPANDNRAPAAASTPPALEPANDNAISSPEQTEGLPATGTDGATTTEASSSAP